MACFTSGQVIISNSTSGSFFVAGLVFGDCAKALPAASANAAASTARMKGRRMRTPFLGGITVTRRRQYSPPVNKTGRATAPGPSMRGLPLTAAAACDGRPLLPRGSRLQLVELPLEAGVLRIERRRFFEVLDRLGFVVLFKVR